jgi:hypothetical protein
MVGNIHVFVLDRSIGFSTIVCKFPNRTLVVGTWYHTTGVLFGKWFLERRDLRNEEEAEWSMCLQVTFDDPFSPTKGKMTAFQLVLPNVYLNTTYLLMVNCLLNPVF